MAAIRFVVQGKGAYTAVEGEKFYMEEGDLILTPNWTWHDHHNESEDPIIWLDGLDGPLIQSLNVLFFEDSEKPEQEITRQTGESLRRMGFARTPKQEENLPPRRAVSLSPSKIPIRRSKRWATAIAILRRHVAALYQSGHRRLHLSDDVLRDSAVQSQGIDQGASPHQHGALPCFQRAGPHQGRRRLSGMEKGDSFRRAALAVARP